MDELKNKIKALLSTGQIDLMIGYGQRKIMTGNGSEIMGVTPIFIRAENDIEQVVWNRHCVHNLATYLNKKDYKGYKKIGILVKPCDLKAINVLLQENQIDRKGLFIIGLSCNGIIKEKMGLDAGHLAPKCILCREAYEGSIATCQPEDVDLVLPMVPEGEIPSITNEKTPSIEMLERMSPKERWAFWQKEFQKCLRCYACRSACPLCYCEQCITDMSQPQWIDKSAHLNGNFLFHLTRAFHMTGRCVGCEECERVCPMGLPLSLLNQKMIHEVKELYHYESGKTPDQAPVLSQFRVEDDESFIK